MFIPLRDTNPRIRRPIVTYSFILANIGIYVLGQYVPMDAFVFVEEDLRMGSLKGLVTLLTYQFLHGGLAHLLFNMLFLFIFGDNIEGSLGRVNFVLFYLATGIVAALSEVYLNPTFGSQGPGALVGASGAISGIMGAYILRYPKAKILTWILVILFIEIRAYWFIGIWILLQFFYQWNNAGSNVAYIAHIGGFISGLIFYWIYHTFRIGKRS